jgi:hypothetical protein
MLRTVAIVVIALSSVSSRIAWGQQYPEYEPIVLPSDAPVSTSHFGQDKNAGPVMQSPVSNPVQSKPIRSNPIQDPFPEMIETTRVPEEVVVEPLDSFGYRSPEVFTSDDLHAPGAAPAVPEQVSRCYLSDANQGCQACGTSACQQPGCFHCNAYQRHLGPISRIKAHFQKSHWGYCNYFDERPFGDSVLAAATRQIQRGLEDSMMLYHYDFYPAESEREAELTPRGRTQLQKLLSRMQITSVPIQVQTSRDDTKLDELRRQHVVSELSRFVPGEVGALVVLAPIRHQGDAVEATRTYENLIQSVISRGRTIQVGERATFGGR